MKGKHPATMLVRCKSRLQLTSARDASWGLVSTNMNGQVVLLNCDVRTAHQGCCWLHRGVDWSKVEQQTDLSADLNKLFGQHTDGERQHSGQNPKAGVAAKLKRAMSGINKRLDTHKSNDAAEQKRSGAGLGSRPEVGQKPPASAAAGVKPHVAAAPTGTASAAAADVQHSRQQQAAHDPEVGRLSTLDELKQPLLDVHALPDEAFVGEPSTEHPQDAGQTGQISSQTLNGDDPTGGPTFKRADPTSQHDPSHQEVMGQDDVAASQAPAVPRGASESDLLGLGDTLLASR